MEPRTLAELEHMTRERLDDLGVNKPRWSSTMIRRAINEAESEACVRAHLLVDEVTDAVTLVDVVAGTGAYVLHPSIYDVLAVREELTGVELCLALEEELTRGDRLWRTREGRLSEYVLQAMPNERLRLLLAPKPTDPAQLRLKVRRTPRYAMEADHDEPEINPRHHDRLVDWAVFRCASVRDPDLYDPVKAQEAERAFEASFGSRKNADAQRRLRERTTHTIRPADNF